MWGEVKRTGQFWRKWSGKTPMIRWHLSRELKEMMDKAMWIEKETQQIHQRGCQRETRSTGLYR